MARVYGITLPAGIEVIYSKTLKMYDVRVHCNIGKNRRFTTRKQRYALRDFSKLLSVAYRWSFLSDPQKAAWNTAADEVGLIGYALFTQDTIYRIMNGLAGVATPSIYHQYLVGHIELSGAANNCTITQHHVTAITLPATLKISYKTYLTADGADPYAKLVLRYIRYWGGKNIYEEEEINIPLSHAWDRQTANISVPQGVIGEWDIRLELNDVQGDIWFDNVILEYGGDIESWDPFCENINNFWVPTDVPSGATVESIYPT